MSSNDSRRENANDADSRTTLENAPVAEPIWSEPKAEIDQYGRPTGNHWVRCLHCKIAVGTGDKDTASHKQTCPLAGTGGIDE
jgi:hypothetical protein